MDTGTLIAIIGIVYLCIGMLLSAVLHTKVDKSGKEYDDFSLMAVMYFNVLLWPIMFYWVYKEIKDDKEKQTPKSLGA